MIEMDIFDSDVLIDIELESDIVVVGSGDRLPDYNGPYKAVPKTQSQTLETKNKSMKDNVTVAEIPYHEISNETGTTVVIGGIL